jgi:HK97 gp10 family phage protein
MKGGTIKFRWTFEGGTELAAALRELSTRISRKVQLSALTDAAEPMRDRMESLAPRSALTKPHLAEQMTISPARGEDGLEIAVAVGPSKEAFYGGLQEFGTANNPAQPFARPGFDSELDVALEILAAAFWRELAARGVSRTVDAPSMPTGGPQGSLT